MINTRLLTALLATALLARADVLPPSQDTSSLKGKLTAATGKATTLAVSATRKGFVRFDLGNLPADVQSTDIVNARLRVYFPTAKKPGDIAIHTVTAAWDETTAALEPGVSVSPIAMFPLATVLGKKFVEVDVTTTLQAWRAGTAMNFGFAFVASGITTVTIGAKEGAASGYPCELDIEIQRGVIVPDGSITAAQLADAAVTNAKLASAAITVSAGSGLSGGGTVTLGGNVTVSLGTNLTLGGTTTGAFSGDGSGLTNLNIAASTADGSITNAKLANSALTVTVGNGLSGGGSVSLGESVAVSLDSNLTLAGTTTGTFSGSFSGDGSGLTNLPTSGFSWQVVSGTSQQAQSNTGYVANNASQVTITLPTAPSVGDTVRVTGAGAGGWKIAQNAGQSVTGKFLGESPSNFWPARESNRNWSAVASSSDGSKLVAVAYNDQIFTSTDSGASWTPRESARTWKAVASSSDGSKLVAGVEGGLIYTSTDSGANWTPRDSVRNWRGIASSADGSKLVAVVANGLIYTSTDSGANWTPRESVRSWRGIASSADGTKLAAVESAGGLIYTSTDSGANWTPRETPRNWVAITSSSDGSKLVAATQNETLFTSTDSGVTWTPRDTGRNWESVASSADGTKLVAAVVHGQLYTSIDSGVNWNPLESQREWRAVASSSDGIKLVAAVYGGLIHTSLLVLSFNTTTTTTTSGTAGYLIGLQSTAVELQYIGGGQFIPISYVGAISSF